MTRQPGGDTTSLWMDTAQMPSLPRLDHDLEVDVCVIGGGLAGLCTAYHLLESGKKIAVLERGEFGGAESLRTTIHLTAVLDKRYHKLIAMHGEEKARLACASHLAAIDRYEQICRTENIDCDFRRVPAYLFPAPEQSRSEIDDEFVAMSQVQLPAERIDNGPNSGTPTGPCLHVPEQAQVDGGRFLAGLIHALAGKGVALYSHSPVVKVGDGPDFEMPVHDEQGPKVRCRQVVVATNSPINNLLAIHTVQAPYRTYVISMRVPHGSVPTGLYWDTADPYHYARIQQMGSGSGGNGAAHDQLIVGGEDHKSGQGQNEDSQERFARLETWTRNFFRVDGPVEYRWSGQVYEPVDGLAFIGANPGTKNVYVITGHSGNGTTYSMLGGMLVADLIAGRANPWADVYSPSRTNFNAAGTFLEENANVAAMYAEYLTPGDVNSIDDIAPGEGAILREGLTKVAVYRDEHGDIHKRSAVCVHMGCIVHWSSTEKIWECPCHGARYDATGACINGPANKDLAPINEPVAAQR